MNSRTADKLLYIERAIDYAINIKADFVVFAGDIFHKINPVERLRVMFFEAIKPLMESGIPTVILVGNHDTDLSYHSLQSEGLILKADDKLWIADEPMSLYLQGMNLLMVPWGKDEKVTADLNNNPTADIVFGHFQAAGATASGTEFHLSNGISSDVLAKFKYTFLGHIHKYQYTDRHAHVGSIAIMDMGEAKDPKGFLHISISKTQLAWDFIPFMERKFYSIEYSEPDPVIVEGLKIKDAVVKVTCTGSDTWMMANKIFTLPSVLTKMGAHTVMPHFIHRAATISAPAKYLSTRSYEQVIKDYATSQKRTDLIDLGIQIFDTGNTCD